MRDAFHAVAVRQANRVRLPHLAVQFDLISDAFLGLAAGCAAFGGWTCIWNLSRYPVGGWRMCTCPPGQRCRTRSPCVACWLIDDRWKATALARVLMPGTAASRLCCAGVSCSIQRRLPWRPGGAGKRAGTHRHRDWPVRARRRVHGRHRLSDQSGANSPRLVGGYGRSCPGV